MPRSGIANTEGDMKERTLTIAILSAIALLAWGGVQIARAQTPGFKRVELQRHDLATPGREVVQARADFDPAGVVPKHTHPGDEVAYVLSGEIVLEVEGKPAAKLKAGDVFFIPAGTVHAAHNPGKA